MVLLKQTARDSEEARWVLQKPAVELSNCDRNHQGIAINNGRQLEFRAKVYGSNTHREWVSETTEEMRAGLARESFPQKVQPWIVKEDELISYSWYRLK